VTIDEVETKLLEVINIKNQVVKSTQIDISKSVK